MKYVGDVFYPAVVEAASPAFSEGVLPPLENSVAGFAGQSLYAPVLPREAYTLQAGLGHPELVIRESTAFGPEPRTRLRAQENSTGSRTEQATEMAEKSARWHGMDTTGRYSLCQLVA